MLIDSTNKKIFTMRLYDLIFLLLLPVILLRTIYKSWKFGEKFSRNYEKLSLFNSKKRNSKKVIHIHAVSVGEVLASRQFVEEVKNKFPNHQILLTCTTQTGSETITKLYGDSVAHQYLPFDISFFVKRFLNFWQPEITFLLETEVWPNLIYQLNRQKRKVFLINARLSEKSFKNYNSLPFFMNSIFSKIDFIVCQGEKDFERFIRLGVNEKKIKRDFSFKFDSLFLNQNPFIEKTFKTKIKKIIICASTHYPEEEILIQAFQMLDIENSVIILVPRHPDRAEAIYKKIIDTDLSISLFSKENSKLNFSKQVILVDKIGYLEDLFSIADIAFIGGSLIPHGGQNFLEAVKFSLPISSGKSVFNFQEIADDLSKHKILRQGNSSEELRNIWNEQLSESSSELKKISQDYILKRKGASKRTLEFLPL